MNRGNLGRIRQQLGYVSRLPRGGWIALGAIALLVTAALLWPSKAADVPTVSVQAGEFIIDLNETGKLRAENSVTLSAPPIRINLQIIWVIPEGTQVEKGDTLLRFDETEIRQLIDDQTAEIDLATANLEKSRASMQSSMSSRMAAVENARASYRLAELRLEQMKFEADVRQEEGRLSLLQAELALKQAENEVITQREIDSADVRSLELKIRQQESDLEKTMRDLDKLTIVAPAQGLVVYKDTWRGGEMSKIKVGDTPWRGQALMELPDLSSMLVETTVNEVDVSKIVVGQLAEVKLDAYPGPVFKAEVMEVAALAHAMEGNPDVKVFDVLVKILQSDPLLKPGMSARVRIIVDRIPDKRWIPIEALFQRDDRSFVWEKSGGGWKQRFVEPGRRNDDYVTIESGLEPGARVALVDPFLAEEDRPKVQAKAPDKPPAPNNGAAQAPSGGRRVYRMRG